MPFRSWIVPLAACFVLSTSAVYAEDKEEKSAKDPNKVVCKKYRPTGTRITKKTCMSQKGWDELQRKAREAAERAQRLGGHQNMRGG